MQILSPEEELLPGITEDMAPQEERIKGLETQMGNIRQALGRIEGQLNAPAKPGKNTHQFLAVMVSALCIAVLWYWGWIGLQVVDQGKKITQIFTLLAPERLSQIAMDATNPESIKLAEQIVANARKSKVPIPTAVLEDVGQKFTEASINAPESWNAALAVVNYRTSLNVGLTPSPSNPVTVTPNTKGGQYRFSLNSIPRPGTEKGNNVLIATVQISGKANPEDSARLEWLSTPQPQGSGAAHIEIIGRVDTLVLDKQFMKNVTILNADVNYDGGPVRLENVTFVNCRLHFTNQQPSRELVRSILRASAVNFSPTLG
jgi:hypothetical protein